jgi:DNA polymerase-1
LTSIIIVFYNIFKIMSSKKLFLLDAFALIYRAHFAFIKRPLINSKGVNVSCVNGFTSLVWDVIQKEKPTHIAVAFDLSGPTFRHEMYEPYKAQREEQPEDITVGLPYIKKIIEAMNIPVVTCQGYEADDVIGTLAKQAEAEGFEVYMITSDKDYGQLVSDHIYLYKPGRMGNEVELLKKQDILDLWGIKRVDQVIDMLGLQGDAVDNIPGVKGIGPKTAQILLDKYDSIEGIIENVDQLPEKQRNQILEYREIALLSKKLAAIDINVPIKFDSNVYTVDPVNKEALMELFRELEFRSLAKRIVGADTIVTEKKSDRDDNTPVQYDLFGNALEQEENKVVSQAANAHLVSKTIENTPHKYHLVYSDSQRKGLIKLLSAQNEFCFDTETTGLELGSEIVGMSFSIAAFEAYYVPLPADQKETMEILEEFRPLFENPNIAKIGQNVKFDIMMLRWHGIEVKGRLWDTMIMHYLIEPDQRHGMDFLSETYLGYSPVPIENLLGKGIKKKISMRDVPLDKIKEYAAEDADVTWQLKQKLDDILVGGLRNVYETIEEPLIRVLAEMEFSGVNLDSAFLAEYSTVMEEEIKNIKNKILEEAQSPGLNLDSPKQIGDVLFEKLKIPYRWKKTKTGQYSTDEEVMTELAPKYPIIQDILDYRQIAKLKSTYIDALPRLVNLKTERLHSSFNQALASTGRLSSNNPNLQNIPIRTDRGREIRKAFIPRDKNHVLLAADYSQIELRLIAEISGDEAMIEAFRLGQDIHTATAARIYGVPLEQVTKEQRYNAKTVNFSIIYGAGATNLSQTLGIKRVEASALIEQYFKQYSGLKKYMENVVHEARKDGFVTTLCGRRRYLRDLDSRNGMMRSHAERNAVNSPIQGSAADMIKLAMVKIHEELEKGAFKTKLILQVHDELVFDVPKEELETVKPIIENAMVHAMPDLKVPIEVGIDTGQNWLEAH